MPLVVSYPLGEKSLLTLAKIGRFTGCTSGKPWVAIGRAIFSVLAVGICLPMMGSAQGVTSVVRSGSFELGGFAGASYGVDQLRVMGGGNVTYAINKWLLPYVEYSYFPGIARTVSQPFPGGPVAIATATYSSPLSDFHAGVHIRIPIRESPIVPYLVVGVGGLTHFQHNVMLTETVFGQQISETVVDKGGTDFAVNFGGGIRYYVNQRFGFRLEAKGYKADSSLTPAFGKVEVGIFYQLR